MSIFLVYMSLLNEVITLAPNAPGVYLMKDEAGRIIYVGKAKNLKKRILTYFQNRDERYQIRFLMNKVKDIDYIITSNEKEALILEDNLVKEHKPRYNIQLKDDKSYLSLMINLNHAFPRLELTRKPKKDNAIFFGPYPSARTIRNIIDIILKIFPLRRCSDYAFLKRKKVCLYFHMGQCVAPCVGKITKNEYKKLVDGAIAFVEGKKRQTDPLLRKLMWTAANKNEFEKAAFLRDIINNKIGLFETQGIVTKDPSNKDIIGTFINGEKTNICVLFVRRGQLIHKTCYTVPTSPLVEDAITQFITAYYTEQVIPPEQIIVEHNLSDKQYLEDILKQRYDKKVRIVAVNNEENQRLLKIAILNASSYSGNTIDGLVELQKIFHLNNVPERIECFDVAHMMGKLPICAVTVMINGTLSKKDYRLFNFDESSHDDYKMLYFALLRRFSHKEWDYPQILMLDGGKGQLSVAKKVLEELHIVNVFPIAITKDEQNSIYICNRKNPIILDKSKDAFKILSKLREEAHRFANLQLKRRLKKQLNEN